MTKRTAVRGMRLCIRNGTALIREARTLANIRAHNRAFVLAALALEEAGKVVFISLVADDEDGALSQRQHRALWLKFRDHKTKTMLALHDGWKSVLYVRRRKRPPERGMAWLRYRALLRAHRTVDGYLSRQRTTSIAEMKLLALYVDQAGQGYRFIAPRRISRAVARGMLQVAESAIRDARRLRDTFRRSNASLLGEQLMAVMFRSQMLRAVLATDEAGQNGDQG